jgi:hypothetical protein
MPDQAPITPGIRILCRDAEWLVTRVEVSDDANQEFAVHCVGVGDLVRGHQAIFLTQLDRIEVIDPRQTRLWPIHRMDTGSLELIPKPC